MLAIWATKYEKYLARIYARSRDFGGKMHKMKIPVKTWHNEYIKDLFIETNRTELQTSKVDERTFGTLCNYYWVLTWGLLNK